MSGINSIAQLTDEQVHVLWKQHTYHQFRPPKWLCNVYEIHNCDEYNVCQESIVWYQYVQIIIIYLYIKNNLYE